MKGNDVAMFIDNLNDYIINLVLNGETVVRAKRKLPVDARQGKVGEAVEVEIYGTVGTVKTVKTVKVDEEGNPDWIITKSNGKKSILCHEAFTAFYDKVLDEVYGKDKLQLLVYCNKTVEFIPLWGGNFTVEKDGTFTIEKGGYFTINGYNDVAGIQPDAFKETYEVVSSSSKDKLEVIKILGGM